MREHHTDPYPRRQPAHEGLKQPAKNIDVANREAPPKKTKKSTTAAQTHNQTAEAEPGVALTSLELDHTISHNSATLNTDITAPMCKFQRMPKRTALHYSKRKPRRVAGRWWNSAAHGVNKDACQVREGSTQCSWK